MSIIVLDPGHGGTPPPNKVGGSSWNNAKGPDGLLEKSVTFDVARRTQSILEDQGHQVRLTRTSDNNVGLRDRAGVAKQSNATVFVSIHFNGFNDNVQGTETFVHNNHSSNSASLCRSVQASVVATTGHKDRNASFPGGVKKAAFSVLKRSSHAANTAAVLVEVSFMDVAAEEDRLRTASYKDRIAAAIADGIEDYLADIGESPGLVPSASAAGVGEIEDAAALYAMETDISSDSRERTDVRPTAVLVPSSSAIAPMIDLNGDVVKLEQDAAEVEENDEVEASEQAQGRAELKYINQAAIRNRKCTDKLEGKLISAVTAVYGADHVISIYSGGQDRKGYGSRRTGSIRHDDFGEGGRAADVYIVNAGGKRVTGLALAKLGQYWLARRYGGVGHEMSGGGIHLDEWTTPPSGGGMYWAYAYSLNKPWGAAARQMLADGAAGTMPIL